MSANYEINTRQKANEALRKPQNQRAANGGNELYPAVVDIVNSDGSYDVKTVDASGSAGQHYQDVMPHPHDTTLAEGDEIWLWMPSGESPIILAAGGGSTCAIGINTFGVLFG